MWITSHRYLAKKIYHYIRDKYGFDLRLDLLQYGSIIPDIQWRYMKNNHYYEIGYVDWLQEIGQLFKDHRYKDIGQFSQKLGIILHYTADYHTYAHINEELKKNKRKHLLYELKLHQALLQYDYRVDENQYRCGNVHSLMQKLGHEYSLTKPSLENDIQFIYTASIAITNLIVEAVLVPAVNAV
ncbi:zinc dependent phospholipase C family protein [Dehalobacter sp. DCM]|uniref:zinc dependent phospholipase C family protein n=1 Tax=Dehalobacter sp. DCM TaxID=2907827 RepID=UPI0030819BEF|nr:zinc dependent phospholipase C family protein [Dehalobacter sp. DCM]